MPEAYRRDSSWSSLAEKIEHYLEKRPDGCWIWTRAISRDGYGQVSWEGRTSPVHRAYLIALGFQYPEGYVTDHLCRVRACANPDHLEIVTSHENTLRGLSTLFQIPDVPLVPVSGIGNADKTHCIRGHEFTPENTRYRNGRRYCRSCWRIRSKVYYDKRHAKDTSSSDQ